MREALRDQASLVADPCVDADALAAWSDGTMSGPDRGAFETHAAGCARCQALMAAMARTEPPAQTEAAWWRRSPFSWLMPLAAATATVVMIVSLSKIDLTAPAPASRIAREESPAASAPPLPTPQPAAPADSRREAFSEAAGRRAQRQAAASRASKPEMTAQSEPKAELRLKDAGATAAAAPAVTLPAPPPAPAPPAPAVSERARAVPPAAADTASAFRDEARADNQALAKMRQAVGSTVIASPARDSQWRIVNGAVEYSDDGGTTWRAQTLGVNLPVRAGSAPAARVCWLAGAQGLVLLTTEGSRWRRIDFPDPVDLVAIEATDASHATVTTAAGRRFGTSDGGQTWTPR